MSSPAGASGSIPGNPPGPIGSGVAVPHHGLDPVLLDILACPADHHAPLFLGRRTDPSAATLTCSECGRVFPIRDGIPVLLLDEVLDEGAPTDRSGSPPSGSGDGGRR